MCVFTVVRVGGARPVTGGSSWGDRDRAEESKVGYYTVVNGELHQCSTGDRRKAKAVTAWPRGRVVWYGAVRCNAVRCGVRRLRCRALVTRHVRAGVE